MSLAFLIVLLLLFFVAWEQRDRFTTVFDRGIAPQIDTGTYQAVFLAGGQVYFGKATASGDVVLIRDVFYLAEPEQGQADLARGQLIKRGNELHAPREPLIVPVDQVLFVENMKPDGQVMAAIARYHSGAPDPTPAATQRPPAPATATPTRSP